MGNNTTYIQLQRPCNFLFSLSQLFSLQLLLLHEIERSQRNAWVAQTVPATTLPSPSIPATPAAPSTTPAATGGRPSSVFRQERPAAKNKGCPNSSRVIPALCRMVVKLVRRGNPMKKKIVPVHIPSAVDLEGLVRLGIHVV